MESETTLQSVPDDELLRRLGELVSRSRRVEADLVSHIGEVEERRLYAREASPSMFAYCTEVLHLSEAEAYLRITVARAAREHSVLLTMLGDGRLHLSGIAKLLPILTRENKDGLLARATHRSKRQIVGLVAELSPRPDLPSLMRKLPQRRAAASATAPQGSNRAGAESFELGPDGVDALPRSTAAENADRVGAGFLELGPGRTEPSVNPTAAPGPASSLVLPPAPPRPAVVEPLSPGRYKVQFTASAQLHDKLERLAALMRAEVPDGDLAAIIEHAVSEKLDRIEARRYAQASAPRKSLSDTDTSPTSRHVAARRWRRSSPASARLRGRRAGGADRRRVDRETHPRMGLHPGTTQKEPPPAC
jgi:hypothetical protein